MTKKSKITKYKNCPYDQNGKITKMTKSKKQKKIQQSEND